MDHQEENALAEAGVVANGATRVPCRGDSCSCTRLKVTQGYPNPPRARIRNRCDHDVTVTIKWGNVLGNGITTHEVWSGETEDVDGPPQYWGVIDYEANRV